MNRRASLTILAAAGSGVACGVIARVRFDFAEGPPEALMPPVLSFADSETVRSALGNPPRWRVFSNAERKGSWAAPRYTDTWVEIPGHQFRGHSGTLRLHFDNGRLEDTRLYPDDQNAVVAEVEAHLGVQFVQHEGWDHVVAEPSQHVMLVAGADGWGKYVSWMDRRLLHESDAWWTLFASGRQDWHQ